MALDKIAVELVAKMDGLQRDFAKASNMAEAAGARMRTSFAGVNSVLLSLGATLAAGFSVRWLGGLAMDSIKAMANLKGLSEQTGVAAATLAKLDVAAQISGVGIDVVAKAMNKLAKGMSGVDKDSKGIPVALKAIGIGFADFSKLDPDAQMLSIAKAFDQFEDGAGKSAVAMTLFGKEGAALLPFFKDLLENQAASVGRTQEMIDASDDFEKNIVRLKIAGGDLLAQTLGPMIPVLDDLAKVMLEATKKTAGMESAVNGLASANGVETWADKAVQAMEFVINAGDGVARVFGVIGKKIAMEAAAIKTAFQGLSVLDLAAGAVNPFAAFNVSSKLSKNGAAVAGVVKGAFDDIDKELREELSGTKIRRLMEKAANDRLLTDAFGPAGATKKGPVKYSDPTGAGKSAEAKDFERITNSLREKIAVQNEDLNVTEKLTDAAKEYAKFQSQVANKTIKLSPEEMRQAEALWRQFLDGAEKLKQKAQEKVFGAARDNITSLSESFGRDNARARDALEVMPAAERDLKAALAGVEEKARTERERFNDLQVRGNINEEQRILLTNKLNEAIARQKGEVTALSELEKERNASFEHGAKKGLQAYLDDVANVAKSSEALIANSFRGMEDALVSFVSTGKGDFKSLVNSMVADLARLMVRQNITGPLANFVSGIFGGGGKSDGGGLFGPWHLNASGGVYTSPSLSAYSGQIVRQPTMFRFASGAGLMGEAGPEAILPLKRGSDGKLGVTSSGGGQEVNINIVVNKDGSDASSAQGDEAGAWQRVADRVKAVVREEMMAQKRPGGVLYA